MWNGFFFLTCPRKTNIEMKLPLIVTVTIDGRKEEFGHTVGGVRITDQNIVGVHACRYYEV